VLAWRPPKLWLLSPNGLEPESVESAASNDGCRPWSAPDKVIGGMDGLEIKKLIKF